MRKICVDRIPRASLVRDHNAYVFNPSYAVFFQETLWQNGSTLRIGFVGGNAKQQDWFADVASEYLVHCNLDFDYVRPELAQIKVSFDENLGSWSYIGTDALDIDGATLNIGWEEDSVVLHEMGHALGMGHEHQNPTDNPLKWNVNEVVNDLSGPPNYWDYQTVINNVIRRYSGEEVNGGAFDPESIMLYSFPANWTVDGRSTDFNSSLSKEDIKWLGRSYPGNSRRIVLPVFAPKIDRISSPGEIDTFVMQIKEEGQYKILTTGSMDSLLRLFSASGELLEQDDDSGEGYNAEINIRLSPSTYTVEVRHYNDQGTGEYTVLALRIQ